MDTVKKVTIFRPGKAFPSLSVTGDRCDLMCAHCRGQHLKGMLPAFSSDELMNTARAIKEDGGNGMLISGGCDIRGRTPMPDRFDTIAKIKEMGLEVNVHTGFLTDPEAQRLVDAGVDAFSVDVHQDPDIIRTVLNMDEDPDIYSRTIDNILRHGGNVIPHLTIGFGTEDLMMSADLLKRKGIGTVTILGLMGTKGTDVIDVPVDGMLEGIRLLTEMGFKITLGCMRPRSHILEMECVKLGVDRIANPSIRTVRWLEDNGHFVEEIRKCCCLPS